MVNPICAGLFLLTLAQSCASNTVPRGSLHGRAQSNPNPVVQGTADTGWQSLPNVVDFTKYPTWELEPGVTIPLFQSSGKIASEIKRAVIVLPGKLRDCWYYGNSMQNALYLAVEKNIGVKRNEVSIMAPCYFTSLEKSAGAATAGVLDFGETTWASGFYNIGPSTIDGYSAYKVLDRLVQHYTDRTLYPNLNVVVVAGHSLGAQMAQRYAAMRTSAGHAARIHYWVANAGSLLWLTEDRPVQAGNCPGTDFFKYGLAGDFPGYATGQVNDLGRTGLVSRYEQRQVHYAWGLNDNGNGDTRCEAMTQGATHLERGQNFVEMLEDMGGIPPAQTVDWIPGVSHHNEQMMNSDGGLDKLFRLNYNVAV